MSDNDKADKQAADQKPAATETKPRASGDKSGGSTGARGKSSKANIADTSSVKSDKKQSGNSDSYQIGRRVWPD